MKRTRTRSIPVRKPRLSRLQSALLLVTGTSLVVGSSSVWAQSTQAVVDTPAQSVVIITGVRKKLESTQDIPSTVNVLSGAELQAQGVVDVKGIEYKIPGLVLGNLGFDGALVGIRGASSTRGFTGDESTVAVHLDGIYVPQSGAALGRLFDVSRIDTLYGPQGTLYGRNAVSGVIDIVSNAPGPKFGGSGSVTFGSFSGRGVDGHVNVPLSQDSGLRVAVATYKDDGYVKNVVASSSVRSVGTDEYGAGRIRYVSNFGSDTRLDVTFQASKDTSLAPFQPRYLDSVPGRTVGVQWRQTAIDQDIKYDRKDSNLAVKLDTAFAGLRLRSITGYTTYEADQVNDVELSIVTVPSGRINVFQDSKAFSQELTLSALDPGDVDWRVGLYYTNSKVTETRFGNNLLSLYGGQRAYDDWKMKQDGDAKAIYGSVDWKASNALTLTVGARTNQESKKQTQDHIYGQAAPAGTVPDCSTVTEAPICRSVSTGDFSWRGTTGDLAAKFQIDKQSMVYARAATGFRSGAVGGYIGQDNYFDQLFFGPGNFQVTKLKPEKLDSIELGVKNTLMGGHLALNAAVFQNKYKDQLFAFTDPVTFRFLDGNVGSSTLKGVDLNAAFSPGNGLRVDASVSYLDGEITKVDPAVGVPAGGSPILAPKLSTSLGVSYRFAFLGGEMVAAGDYNFKDEMYQDLQNTVLRPPVELFNFNVGWTAPGGGWKLFAAVNNFFNKKYLSRPANELGAAPIPVFVGEPRKWRLGASINF
jgi:iron complex outermembrane recepter protein